MHLKFLLKAVCLLLLLSSTLVYSGNVVCKIIVIIALMFMVSCSKEQSRAGYFNETYADTYKLVSATYAPDSVYFTDPIDFEGSVKKTKDIIGWLIFRCLYKTGSF